MSVLEAVSAVHVEALADRLHIHWTDSLSDSFHYVWLRDNCGCSTCRHPIAGERLSDPAAIPLDIAPTSVSGGESVKVLWPDGHESTFSPNWLRMHAYGDAANQRVTSPFLLWSAADVASPPEADFHEITKSEEALLVFLRQLRSYGFSIVRNVPTDQSGRVAEIAKRIGNLRDSNFGLIWDVKSVPKPDSLAYTSVKLTAHTDLVSRESQPGLQLLHCRVNEAEGGASLLVDGFAVAEELKRRSIEDFEVLSRVPASFRYQNDFTDVSATGPVIKLDHRSQYFEIRYSNALLAPLQCDGADVAPFYRAYQHYSRLLREPQFEFSFRLEAGDCEVFDNRRVLHGRQEFFPQSGPRLLEGCYVDTDDYLSRLRVLERTSDFRKR